MRVLYLENTIGFGGSITGLVELIDHIPDIEPILLASYDVRQHLSLPAKVELNLVPPSRRGTGGGIVLNLARMIRNDIVPWYRAIDRIHRKQKIDLIHGNNSCQTNLAAALFGRIHGIPTVSHQKCFEHSGKLNRLLLAHTLYSLHIATSPSIGEHLVQLGLPADRCRAMFEPVRAPAPAILDKRLENPVPVIGMYSMLTPWKGQDVFLKGIAELRQRTDVPFRVILAGSAPDGDMAYPAELKRLARELGLDSLVEFRGHIRDVYPFLVTLDIAVHASITPEPFGRVVAEAMICGVPVIVSKAGGPSGYVKDGKTGLHATMGDPSALARCMQRLLENPALRRQLATEGQRYALHEFDPSRLGREMLNTYQQLVTIDRTAPELAYAK